MPVLRAEVVSTVVGNVIAHWRGLLRRSCCTTAACTTGACTTAACTARRASQVRLCMHWRGLPWRSCCTTAAGTTEACTTAACTAWHGSQVRLCTVRLCHCVLQEDLPRLRWDACDFSTTRDSVGDLIRMCFLSKLMFRNSGVVVLANVCP